VKKAFITGVTGQDGAYLVRFLLEKGYEVHAIKRRTSTFSTARLDDIYNDPKIHEKSFLAYYADLHDGLGLMRVVHEIEPDEVYNLAAQSHVHISFDQPEYTGDSDGLGTTRLLEAIRTSGLATRFYQASTSEMFGSTPPPQNEGSAFHPRSPYAAAKLYAHWMTVNYRESYGMFACSGILFNHESPRRGENFVTRKVTRGVAGILARGEGTLRLGTLDSKRDWGHARDYVEAMWLMLQQPQPDDYVIGTGITHSIGELVEVAFGLAGLDWRRHVELDAAYRRPAEVDDLRADWSKAREKLGWAPKTTFEDLIREMLESDVRAAGLDEARFLKERTGPAVSTE
jgi:GDPmannose 4,6-dehydratase